MASVNGGLAGDVILALVVALTLPGCPSKSERPDTPPQPCTKFAQSCEVSPGKLGTCVQRDNCVGQNCFVCQSQH